MAEGQAAVDGTETPRKARRCVLFVHGVGEQHKSHTLLWMGSSLVEWVLRWCATFYPGQHPSVGRTELSFNPYDARSRDSLPCTVLHLPDQDWYLAEAWWAASNYHPDFKTMLTWSWKHLWDILAQMRRATRERSTYLFTPKQHSSAPGPFWRAVDLLNCVAVLVLYFIAAIVGYPLLIVLMALAQIPLESVQNFIVVRVIRPLLTTTAGEFKMYMDDEIQAGNIRRRVADAARELTSQAGCQDVVLIAHSEGAVVSLGTLTDPTYSPIANRIKLITLGGGLNKSWLIRPELDRLFTPLRGNVEWSDFWSSYDPVPAGGLDPSPHKITDIYQPNGTPSTPISAQVTNNMEILTDHGAYFENDEQILIRLAAEISAPVYRDSVFWPREEGADSDAFLHAWVRRRRQRVSVLALWRDIAVAAWLGAAVVPWLVGWLPGVQPWGPLAQVPTNAGLAGMLVVALRGIRDWLASLPGIFAPLAGMFDALLSLPAALGLAVLAGIACWAIYRLVLAFWWSPWDRRAKAAFAAAAAEHSHRRLASTPVRNNA
jgi:hypothetical protein